MITPSPDRTPPPATPAEMAPQFVLAQVVFEGGKAVDPAALAPAWAPYRDKTVTLADLRKIARQAERLYAAAGYPFVAIVVTPQEVAGGVVHMRVVEGRVSDLTVLAKDPTARRQTTAAFSPLVGVSPLSLAEIEGAYQRARDIPGLALAGALRRGSEPGGMDLVVQAKRETWRAYANVNNLYPDATGPWGALVGLDHFGNSTWGDETSLQAFSSLDDGHQYVIRLSHLQRLNASGTTVSATGLAAWASPAGAVAPLDIATNVQDLRFAISQPLVERTRLSITAEGAFEVDNQKTKVFKTIGLSDDRLRILSASIRGDWRPAVGGHATLAFELRKGVDIFGASNLGDPTLSRVGADPEALIARVHFEGETPNIHKIRLYGHIEGQTTDHALTAPEQFALGNLTIGRGYEPGAAFGDRALAATAEVRFGPFGVGGGKYKVEPFMFYDGARLWTLTPGAFTRRDLWSWGGGLRVDLPSKLRLEVAYAAPQTPPLGLGEPTPHARLLVNVTVGLNDLFSGLAGRVSKGSGK